MALYALAPETMYFHETQPAKSIASAMHFTVREMNRPSPSFFRGEVTCNCDVNPVIW